MRIVETDNMGGDYPDEKFVNLPWMPKDSAQAVCNAINNACSGDYASRYWKMVPDDYKLRPGFTP